MMMDFTQGILEWQGYAEVIEGEMLPQVREWSFEGDYVCIHDGVSCHRTQRIPSLLVANDV